MNYKKLTKKFLDANFRVFGIGHFDITKTELEKLFEILLIGNDDDLFVYYEKLKQKRMG